MILSDSSSIEDVSPKKAETWLISCKYNNQRKIRPYHVSYLAAEMKKGKFMASAASIQFCFCAEDGGTYLVNGQHTLTAIIESGITLNGVNIVRTIADTLVDVNALYTKIDNQNKRTFRDSIRAFNLEEIWKVGQEASRSTCTAAVWIKGKFHFEPYVHRMRQHLSYEDMIDLGGEWIDEYREFDRAISPCEGDIRLKLHYPALLAVVLVTFRYKHDEAREFWRQVAQDDGLKVGDPRKTLQKWMMSHTAGRGNKVNKEVVHADSFPIVAAKAWTRWMQGEDMKNVRVNFDERVEDSLLGISKDKITQHYIS